MFDAEAIIFKLLSYFQLDNNQELALKLGTTPQTISNWKTRNSISPLKKKCRELGIYNEIFGDLTHSNRISVNNNTGQIARTVQGNQTQNLNQKEDEYIIPETILDDINILFKLAIENEKEDDLINLIDEFIFSTKKELRKK
ncbi:helix-turn-helix domain-containing protein [Aliarcobacter cryaerophilus]|uniref:helix-turn-helix domain-containing protein n=1 Tax=Aliarcobacter cryaerophilus TaxID=28198 RepID=UPI0021B44515|nr:helix-turn-helix domain-containing protein [Aliarcobacter cryaerophilus]MCT7468859.1 hypothetical protein [Aliarcobacter cryaerophilus]